MAPTWPLVGARVRPVLTAKVAEALALLVAPTPLTVWLPLVASGTTKVVDAPPVAEAPTLLRVAPSHLRLTVSLAPYPLRATVTVAPTARDVGETAMLGVTVKVAEARLPPPPAPSTLCPPLEASGTMKV